MSGGDWKELFQAACDGDLELLAYHVRAGVDLNYAHPEFLSTPLVAAILARQPAAALVLLAHGADPALGSEFDAMTPMQAAVATGLVEVQAALAARGIPVPPPPAAATPARPGGALGWLRGRARARWRGAGPR